MNIAKWLGAALGWSLGGPIGAVIGLALGGMVDSAFKNNRETPEARRKNTARTQTTSGDFEVSLLILSSLVIKADNQQHPLELDYVRNYFSSMYGKERANHAFKLFKEINKQQISTRQVCLQIRSMMDHASRLQLIHYLFGIAQADGQVVEAEVKQIHTISGYLGVRAVDFESIKSMFYNNINNAYKILEIEKTATVTEIKAAYRKMVKKYHPDRVIHLGEEHQKGAEEKFKQVQKAYEQLQKERGF